MHLTLYLTEGTFILQPDDVICLQAISNYTRFYLPGNRVLLSARCLKQYAELLEGSDFCRVHKSYLINKQHVKNMEPCGKILMSNLINIHVARRKKKQVQVDIMLDTVLCV